MKSLLAVAVVALFLSGCMTATEHREAVRDDSGDRITVGRVQQGIRVGMSGAEVAEILGSPNIVSTDEQRREVWMYDKISTEEAYSTTSGGIATLILAGFVKDAGASSRSQRTLTVIIKFDGDGKVRDFAYHTSRF